MASGFWLMVTVMLAGMIPVSGKVVSFADNGGLKMFYDNRMYPQAVALGNEVHIVWRGYEKGYPHLITYDLENGKFSDPRDLMIGYEDQINQGRYRSDHHYAPVIWSDENGHLHVLHGCHRTSGIHLISRNPRSADAWVRGPDIADSISYPQVHRIYQDQTLLYSRWSGHLGHWQYHISADGGRTWQQSPRAVIDLNGEPQDYFRQVFWSGLTGVAYLPSTIVPTGPDDAGLPIGVQIAGPEYGDLITIAVAQLLEREGFAFRAPAGFDGA